MPEKIDLTCVANDFEFEPLEAAEQYRAALAKEFRPYLRGQVVEVGAGVGHMSAHLASLPEVQRAVLVEPESRYVERLSARFPRWQIIHGTVADVPATAGWNALLSVNVLEHVRDDVGELQSYEALLRRAQGTLCLFVPARPEIYAPIDKSFGHVRRYTLGELRQKLWQAGFAIERLFYYNLAGYLGWWLNFCVLRKLTFEPWKLRVVDRWIFPLVHALETKVVRPPFGQSLLAVARCARQAKAGIRFNRVGENGT